MAKVFKGFGSDDIATTRTLLHEAIPISGAIVNGATYDESDSSKTNIKNYEHEMFQSVYDYTYTLSASNHIFDVTVGINKSSLLNDSTDVSVEKKQIIYNEFAQILAGHDIAGDISAFDADGDLTGGNKHNECYVISVARLLNKDEIKKGSFYMKLNVQPESLTPAGATGARQELLISDEGSQNTYKVNSPAGDYGILKCRTYKHYEGTWSADQKTFTQTSTDEVFTIDYDSTDTATGVGTIGSIPAAVNINVGLVFYQAGVVILSPNVFAKYDTSSPTTDSISFRGVLPPDTGAVDNNGFTFYQAPPEIATGTAGGIAGGARPVKLVEDSFTDLTIPQNCDGLRNRIHQIAFNNTTELNSTIYFCRANHNEFNYSSNPTYLNAGKIRVKEVKDDAPVSYITSVGLYSDNNELLAVAKLSEPLRKDPTNEMVLRVRLDY